MRDYILYRYPGYSGESVKCDWCDKIIQTLKFENVSHRVKRSRSKKLVHDFSNLDILCGPTDYWGEKDTSCHTRYEINEISVPDNYDT